MIKVQVTATCKETVEYVKELEVEDLETLKRMIEDGDNELDPDLSDGWDQENYSIDNIDQLTFTVISGCEQKELEEALDDD